MSSRDDCLFGDVEVHFLQSPLVVVTRKIGGEMGVRVHEPGRKRGVAEVDDLRALRDREIATGIDDFVALNDDDAVRNERFRFAIEKARGFESDRGGLSRESGKHYRRERGERREKAKEILHGFGYEIRSGKARPATIGAMIDSTSCFRQTGVMRRIFGFGLALLLVARIGCAADDAATLSKLADDFWKWRAKFAPFTGDDVNRIERPGPATAGRDWSRAAIDERGRELSEFVARWRKIDPKAGPIA